MSSLRVLGTPQKLDIVWRPVARVLLVGTAVVLSIGLWWFSQWLWLPVPIIVAFVSYELIFWLRGDRAIVCTVSDTALQLVDVRGEKELHVRLDDVRAASLGWRVTDRPGLHQAFLVLHGDRDVLFAARFDTGFSDWTDLHTDLAALAPVLGGNAGVLRALAGFDKSSRQVLQDPKGHAIRDLLQRLPDAVWRQAAVRVWQGEEPELDYLGLHEGPPTGLLRVGDGRYVLHTDNGVIDGTIGDVSTAGTSRTIQLMRMPNEQGDTGTSELPVLAIHLGDGVNLAVPAPVAGHLGDEVTLKDDALHTHLAEAVHVVWRLLAEAEPGRVQGALTEAVRESRVVNPLPHKVLSRHM